MVAMKSLKFHRRNTVLICAPGFALVALGTTAMVPSAYGLVVQLNTPGKGKVLKSKARDIALALAPLLAK